MNPVYSTPYAEGTVCPIQIPLLACFRVAPWVRVVGAFVVAVCFALAACSSRAQSDLIFVADDGVNTGGVGEYHATIGSGSAVGSAVNAGLVTTAPAGASAQVRMSLATDGQGDLFVGEWVQGASTATIGEYTLTGSPINAGLLTISDSVSAPVLAADGHGNLFVAAGQNLSEYSTSGSLEKTIATSTGAPNTPFTSLALDGSGNLFAASSGGNQLLGNPDHGNVSEYTTSGSLENAHVLTATHLINSIAVGGGSLYVSYMDSAPEIFDEVSKYNTDGTLVNAALIPNIGGHLALDGQGDLFVSSYGDGTISAYTTGGTPLTSDFLKGVTEAEDMAVLTVPEPSITALAIAGLVAMMLRRKSRCA